LNEQELSRNARERREKGPEEQKGRADYSALKRFIKALPMRNDTFTIERVWVGALTILNGADRDWKQMLSRDLDDEAYCSREHMYAVVSLRKYLTVLPLGHNVFSTTGLLVC